MCYSSSTTLSVTESYVTNNFFITIFIIVILQPGDADTQWGVFFIHLIFFFFIFAFTALVMEFGGENL